MTANPMGRATPLLLAANPLYGQDVMLCPFCNEVTTHIDEVVFSHRQEDRTPHKAIFDAVEGVLRLRGACPEEYSSRRHWVGLVIDCESCAGGMVVFAQHKGVTHVVKVLNPSDARQTNHQRLSDIMAEALYTMAMP